MTNQYIHGCMSIITYLCIMLMLHFLVAVILTLWEVSVAVVPIRP